MILRGSLPSAILGMDTGITVVTPGTYHEEKLDSLGKKLFKAVYLLHGLYGNNSNWADNTMLPVYANEYQVIFIMPEAGRSLYTDMAYGLRYFTYISEELPEICRKTFHISAAPEDTFAVGGSMGGYGALKCAFSRPDVFGHCMAFSSAGLFMKESLMKERQMEDNILERDGRNRDMRLLRDFKAAFGEKLECSGKDDILTLIDWRLTESAGGILPSVYMMCGKQDTYISENRRFADEMIKRPQISFQYQEVPGTHDWYYFDAALKKGLEEIL